MSSCEYSKLIQKNWEYHHNKTKHNKITYRGVVVVPFGTDSPQRDNIEW